LLEHEAMKRFVGWAVSAGLMFAATAANAQMLAPYRAVSDFDGPYAAPYGAPPPPPPPVYNYGGYAPALLPPTEVYAVLRDNGFSPLGIPHQRGMVYTISVVDRNGEDGRLVIDARNGRIIRFMPAWGPGWGREPSGGPNPYDESFNAAPAPGYGAEVALPPPTVIRGVPRPPATVPHVASRAVPLPAPKPAVARAVEPAQRSAAVETKPATPPAAQPSSPPAPATQTAQAPAPAHASAPASASPAPATVGENKPAPVIQPTQEMPKVQGLE
jgi:hypothetical protein